jgi:hypothetical protein
VDFARILAGRALAAGKLTADVVAAIGEAAAEVNAGANVELIKRTVRKFCDHARAPRGTNGVPVQPPSPHSKTIVLGKDRDPNRGEGPGLFDDPPS